ncbi:AraC-like DNA-binding protein [Neolewinella xylanilytica]|uniref:AraC-like DNA-binding protein n=1 Tax=Neolewinella xylanilytica TaxID=1514080 RepID=A0A2S6I5W8_9BACT|nr:AraC family transcriptional regulator [Neolewinella xylanilytica]PPK86558.1 AraC-like DNA-binding protein [Neolewinella xylanilytica]
MLQLQEASVIDTSLKPYVKGYGLLRLSSTVIREKEILPWPGSFLLFASQAFELDGQAYPFGCVRQMHDAASRLRWKGDELEVFTVRFAPYGLRPFLVGPVDRLRQRDMETASVWNVPLPSIYEDMLAATALNSKVKLVEDFLVSTLDPKSIDSTDDSIMQLADAIRREPSEPFGPLRERVHLSNRQFARRFKALIGVNLRTYVRICRFAHAKTSLLLSPTPSLTQLGYEAGYFDQAHFSRDFSALAERSPKLFPSHYPLHRLISERHD